MSSYKKYFPILDWLGNYKKEDLGSDFSAGLTVGVMLIPQGMAYAMIAGLSPVYGLYAAMIPQIIYSVFGTSRQLSVGPVAMDSLLVAAGVSAMATVGTDHYVELAILLALMMGTIQLIFGVFKMGFLVNFLSKPVISGFTSAAAIVIGFNQFSHVVGFKLFETNVLKIFWELLDNFSSINWITVSIAVLAIAVVKFSKKIHPKVPGALLAVTASILVVYFTKMNNLGVNIVKDIPQGLPSFSIPSVNTPFFKDLLPIAFTLALIAFMEAISVAKAIQSRHKKEYKLDNNQEMIALGMSNIVGSFFAAYPTTGGFSRSAVNDQAGAKTNLAALISAALIGLTLLFLTPLFYYLPHAVLGAIILVAVFGLIDIDYPKLLFKQNKQEFAMLAVAFTITLFVGIKEGIGAGVLVSLLALVYRTSKPHIAVLGRLPNTDDYRNIKRFDNIETRKDVLIIRHDAQLYFANATHFVEFVKAETATKHKDLKLVILDCGSISSIDTTALQELRELIEELNEKGIGFYLCSLVGPVRDFLSQTGFVEEVGENHFFIDVQSAINYLDGDALKNNKQMLKLALQNNVFKEKEI